MYGTLPQLQNLRDLEEKIGEEVTHKLLLIFAFINSRNIAIQCIYKSIKFQKYIYGVRVLLG